MIAVNLKRTFNCAKEVVPLMKEQRYGKIINISSVVGKIGDIASAPSYGTSKGAINAFTKSSPSPGSSPPTGSTSMPSHPMRSRRR